MIMTEFAEFASRCGDSGFPLDSRLVNHKYLDLNAIGEDLPNSWYAAVAAAGQILGDQPDIALTRNALLDDILGAEPGFAQHTLLRIISDSLFRVNNSDSGTTFGSGSKLQMGSCLNAEVWFGETFDAMEQPGFNRYSSHGKPIGWTILTSGCEPIAVTKSLAIGSTLSLAEFVLNGVRYPAGSLFALKYNGIETPDRFDKFTTSSLNVAKLAFMRLTAFALPPSRRYLEFPQLGNKHDVPSLREKTLADIRNLSRLAIAHSQIMNPAERWPELV